MEAVLADANIGLVASFVLAGGTLTGKYAAGATGRASTGGITPEGVRSNPQAAALIELAQEWDVSPTSLAFSFVLSHPRLSSVLFGATSPAQLRENVASLKVFESLSAEQLARLRAIAARGA
jgi:aryl-alcohol dehydrogenase-like predicted oxidoreductase